MTPPPWLMWGNSVTVRLEGGNPSRASQQIARISYGRPDSWSFLVGFVVTDTDFTGGTLIVQAQFDLSIGIGRSVTQLRPFAFFQFANPVSGMPVQWATKVPSPLIVPSSVNVNGNLAAQCDQFPAQDIQLQGAVFVQGAVAGTYLQADMFGYFAPRSHVRPEWYLNDVPHAEQFRGHENKGT